jgi:hypothetical protein
LGRDYCGDDFSTVVQREKSLVTVGFAGVLTAVGLPYAFFWSWLKGKVKLNQIRNGRRLARLKALR